MARSPHSHVDGRAPRPRLAHPERPATIAAEVAADLVQPWHALAGMVRPRQIQWRSRAIRLDGDGVSYR
ncbi:MAG: hypothetical protein IPN45_04810 [Actinomycetales bacterium]|nr:hypothetical protein [Actinomycetales bacterium]